MTFAARKFAVVGAGWAGCTAAVELARLGHQVSLFERARTLGGRARAVEIHGKLLDNGQHIMLGAYTDTLRLMRTVGIDADQAFLHLPLQMRYPAADAAMDFMAPRLPAPLHLLAALWRAKGLAFEDKLSLVRFSSTARWMDWRLDNDCTVAELLERFDQTDRLIRLLWRPLCIAALNTPPERASAQVFLNVLRDSLGAKRRASDMLVPRLNLTSLFPACAAAYVERAGGTVRTGCAIDRIEQTADGWMLHASNGGAASPMQFDAAILATPPDQAATMIDGLPGAPALTAFEFEPITTCYLQYPAEVRLPLPFFALVDDPSKGNWGQFVFDRGQLDADQAGLLAVVVSASSQALALGPDLASVLAAQLARALQLAGLAQPLWTKVISEKRATFSCTPGLVRPPAETGLHNLYLAGDYVASDYPATLESAVRSGIQAARLACA